MSINITIRDIPDDIYEKVREQAKVHHRSINSEIIACLESSVKSKNISTEDILNEARKMRKKAKGSLSTQEIIDAINRGRP